MTPGEKKTVHIPVHLAYGHYQDENVMEFPKSEFPADLTPEVGMELQMGDDSGNVFPVVIVNVKEDTVELDGNHPLAGKDLIFDLELVSIG
jgi:peptidylprolyl isomerase